MAEQWIVVPNWDRFQHYSDRDPPWIKLYTELNSRAEWLQMSVAERGLLCTIWVEYARSREQCTRSQVQVLCTGSARDSHWTSLNDAGFIQFAASKPSRTRSRESEKSREEKKKGSPSAKKTGDRFVFTNGPVTADRCPSCGCGPGLHTSDCELVHAKPR